MTEFDRDKINAVYKYLSNAFPELSIKQTPADDRMALKFDFEKDNEKYVVKFDKKYWDRCDAHTLYKHIKRLDVANALRKDPQENVIVSQSINLGFEPK